MILCGVCLTIWCVRCVLANSTTKTHRFAHEPTKNTIIHFFPQFSVTKTNIYFVHYYSVFVHSIRLENTNETANKLHVLSLIAMMNVGCKRHHHCYCVYLIQMIEKNATLFQYKAVAWRVLLIWWLVKNHFNVACVFLWKLHRNVFYFFFSLVMALCHCNFISIPEVFL